MKRYSKNSGLWRSKLIYAIIFAVTLVIDQLTKIKTADLSGLKGTLSGGGTKEIYTVIKNFLVIEYCENVNGVMGLFKNLPHSQTIFLISTVIIMVVLVVYICLSKKRSKWLGVALALILSGALGNFIDRVSTEYVRDFIHVIIKINGKEYFPYIFNVADICVCVGAAMLLLYLLFIDEEALLKPKKKNFEVSSTDSVETVKNENEAIPTEEAENTENNDKRI